MKKREEKQELTPTETRLISRWDKARLKKVALKAGLIAIPVIILAIILFIVFTKVSITFSNELNIVITPLQQSKAHINSDNAELVFEIENDNLVQCSTSCKFELYEPDNYTVTYSSIEKLSHGQKLKKSFGIQLPRKGSGQVMYTFKARCHNIKSLICLTNEEDRSASAIALINYDLTGPERLAKETYKSKIESLATKTGSAISDLKLINSKLIPEGTKEGNALKETLRKESALLENAKLKSERLVQLWDLEEYITISREFNESEFNEINESQKRLSIASSEFQKLVFWRNQNLNNHERAGDLASDLAELASFYSAEENLQNNGRLDAANEAADALYSHYNLIIKNITHSEEESSRQINDSLAALQASTKEYHAIRAEISFLVLYGQNLLLQKNITHLAPASTMLDCDGLKSAAQAINLSHSIAYLGNNTLAYGSAEYNSTLQQIINAALLSTIEDAQNLRLSEQERIIALASARVSNGTAIQDLDSEKAAQVLLPVLEHEKALQEYCKQGSPTNSPGTGEISRLLLIDFSGLSKLRIELGQNKSDLMDPFELKENPAICCSLGSCSPCCDRADCKDQDYPILFVHGHAFNNRASPEFSLTLFNDLQDYLEQDGFINMDKLELEANEDDLISGAWGRQAKPVSMKSSYYYITHYDLGDYTVSVQNDESIENYAIRLKEIIDLVIQKTGKAKVNLVAHSMGGLVSREYIDLFGSGKVNKLITINTPHKGVAGRTKDWCDLLGSSKECNEMSEESIFLSRLNSKKLPEGLPVYVIYSTGCVMETGADGDGVVLTRNAKLEGDHVTNIEIRGNCTDTLQSSLHNDLLNPEKYPQAYEVLRDILVR